MAGELEKWHRSTLAGASAAQKRGEDNKKEISRLASEMNGVRIEGIIDRQPEGAASLDVASLPHFSMPDTALHKQRAVW